MGELQTSGRPIDSLVEKVLCMNILSSDYYKELFALKTYHEIVDEIYNQVDHVEPWMTGNCRGPSTAFCLLYKFLTMKLTVKQMHSLLQHPDSPYIRAVGFLYLRYAADGKTLWNWFEPYVNDEEVVLIPCIMRSTIRFWIAAIANNEMGRGILHKNDKEFSPGSNGRKTTMGVYVRDLLLGQYYFDTLFPRVPVTALRQITSNLEKMNLPTKPSGSIGENSRFGSEDTARRPPSVKAALSVSFGQRAPHRASTRDSSPVRRILPPSSSYDRSDRDNSRRSPSRHRSQSRELSDRDRDRDRNQDLDRGRDRYRDRNRDYDRDTDRRRDYDRPRYSEREGSRRDRDSDRRNEYRSRRSRSRSRSPSQQAPSERFESHPGSRRDAGREKEKGPTSSNLAKLKDLYGDVSEKKGESSMERGYKDSATDEVFRLGGSTWR